MRARGGSKGGGLAYLSAGKEEKKGGGPSFSFSCPRKRSLPRYNGWRSFLAVARERKREKEKKKKKVASSLALHLSVPETQKRKKRLPGGKKDNAIHLYISILSMGGKRGKKRKKRIEPSTAFRQRGGELDSERIGLPCVPRRGGKKRHLLCRRCEGKSSSKKEPRRHDRTRLREKEKKRKTRSVDHLPWSPITEGKRNLSQTRDRLHEKKKKRKKNSFFSQLTGVEWSEDWPQQDLKKKGGKGGIAASIPRRVPSSKRNPGEGEGTLLDRPPFSAAPRKRKEKREKREAPPRPDRLMRPCHKEGDSDTRKSHSAASPKPPPFRRGKRKGRRPRPILFPREKGNQTVWGKKNQPPPPPPCPPRRKRKKKGKRREKGQPFPQSRPR